MFKTIMAILAVLCVAAAVWPVAIDECGGPTDPFNTCVEGGEMTNEKGWRTVPVTDAMALAFHNALTDGSIGQAEVEEIKTGLRAALAAAPTPPKSELTSLFNLPLGTRFRYQGSDKVFDLNEVKFKRFNNEDCWIYQGNGEDNLESLACPVVISAEKLAALEAENARLKESNEEYRSTIFTNTNREMTMTDRFFVAEGGFISDENFDFDAGLRVSGDFVDDEKEQYALMIACALNNAAKANATIAQQAEQLAAAEKDAERYLSRIDKECLRIGREIQRAAGELPPLFEIHVNVEREAGWVTMTTPEMKELDFPDTVEGISFCISAAIDAAFAAHKEGK